MYLPPTLHAVCMQQLETIAPGIEWLRLAAICSTDGFPIAMVGEDTTALDSSSKATAMAAALDGLCKTISQEFGLGALEGTVLECAAGLALCRRIHVPEFDLVLFLIMQKEVSYGHALWTIKNAAKSIANVMRT